MKKIAIIGSKGQLGDHLMELLKGEYELVPLSHEDISIENMDSISSKIKKHKPNIVINTAAYHKVDECEANPNKAFMVNAIGARNLAVICSEINAVLVHISTDYVFDGKNMPQEGYSEFESANPLNIYGKSKLRGELFIKRICLKYFIIRTSWLFGAVDTPESNRNFILKVINLLKTKKPLKIIEDQIGTPTYTLDVAKKIAELIKTEKYGLYHISNTGRTSWYELALEIKKLTGFSTPIKPCKTKDFKTRANRPKLSVLRNYMLKLNGFELNPTWEDALSRYINLLKSRGIIQGKE